MSSICSQVLGSNIFASFVPNLDCSTKPKLHQVIITEPANATDEKITIGLDPAYQINSVNAYNANSLVVMYARTKIFIGGQFVEILTPKTLLTTTPVEVDVAPLLANIADNAVGNTYMGAIPCTSDLNIAAPPQTATNSNNCSGNLLTDVNTGYKRTATIMGFPDGKDAVFWDLMVDIGKALKSVHYMVNYDNQYSETGVMQLSFPDFQQGSVAQIQKYQISGQVQSFEMQKGSVSNTPTEQALINAKRALWGFPPAN